MGGEGRPGMLCFTNERCMVQKGKTPNCNKKRPMNQPAPIPVDILVAAVQSCPTLCNPTDCSMPRSSVFHYRLEFAQSPVH